MARSVGSKNASRMLSRPVSRNQCVTRLYSGAYFGGADRRCLRNRQACGPPLPGQTGPGVAALFGAVADPLGRARLYSRAAGALWGLFVGDSMGMPTMWFYRPPVRAPLAGWLHTVFNSDRR